jgi:hypothetical protein
MCQHVGTHGLKHSSDQSYEEARQNNKNKKTIVGTAESLGETGDSR